MLFNPKLVSTLLAISIAVTTTAFLSLVPQLPLSAFVVVFAISFSSAFLLIYFALGYLVLDELKEVYAILEKIKKKDFKIAKKRITPTLSPIKKLNYEIYNYASNKQKEIDHLKKLEIYRREFLADVSHELKTPIFAAQGFLHTLIDGAINDVEVRDKFLHKAATSLDGLNRLVEDLFTLSKMEAGFIKMNCQDFGIAHLIQEAMEELEPASSQKNITMDFYKLHPQSDSVQVNADRGRIKQVMINLLENAIKYGKNNGKVQISLAKSEDSGQILLRIEDNGPGIPSVHLDRIFERFYRVEKSRSKEKGGSGLGLAIVKHILEAHHSKISVNSKVKQGTTFSFELSSVASTYNKTNPAKTLGEDQALSV